MPHIVSLIASATEIVCALGYGDQLVGRSHECDYPKEVERLPVCTGPRFDVTGSSREIDELVKATLRESPSVYRVDAELLQALEPDVIVTQAQCEVCAVSEKDVVAALGADQGRTRVVVLTPLALADVWHNIGQVAEALGVPERGQALAAALQQRVASIAAQAQRLAARPTVACLEWLDPLMAAGNWVPELVELAGGVNLFGAAGRHAPALGWDELCRADPDVIVALPCGFDLQRTRRELAAVAARPGWDRLTSVRQGRVYATDGNQFFNRPGPRLVESLEILAEILHPQAFPFGHAGSDWCALRDR